VSWACRSTCKIRAGELDSPRKGTAGSICLSRVEKNDAISSPARSPLAKPPAGEEHHAIEAEIRQRSCCVRMWSRRFDAPALLLRDFPANPEAPLEQKIETSVYLDELGEIGLSETCADRDARFQIAVGEVKPLRVASSPACNLPARSRRRRGLRQCTPRASTACSRTRARSGRAARQSVPNSDEPKNHSRPRATTRCDPRVSVSARTPERPIGRRSPPEALRASTSLSPRL